VSSRAPGACGTRLEISRPHDRIHFFTTSLTFVFLRFFNSNMAEQFFLLVPQNAPDALSLFDGSIIVAHLSKERNHHEHVVRKDDLGFIVMIDHVRLVAGCGIFVILILSLCGVEEALVTGNFIGGPALP